MLLCRVFPPSQLLILRLEDYERDLPSHLAAVLAFLALPTPPPQVCSSLRPLQFQLCCLLYFTLTLHDRRRRLGGRCSRRSAPTAAPPVARGCRWAKNSHAAGVEQRQTYYMHGRHSCKLGCLLAAQTHTLYATARSRLLRTRRRACCAPSIARSTRTSLGCLTSRATCDGTQSRAWGSSERGTLLLLYGLYRV